MMTKTNYMLLITFFCLSCLTVKVLYGQIDSNNLPVNHFVVNKNNVNPTENISHRELTVSSNELSRLMDSFNNSLNPNSATQARIILQGIYKEIIFIYLGTEFTEMKKRSFSINQIDSMKSNLKSNNPLFRIKLGDVFDERKMSVDEIEKLRSNFILISKKLKYIRNNALYKTEKDGNVYYTIPENTFYIFND